MDDMTPTDKLRAILDEIGIDHYDHENGEPLRDLSEAGTDPATSWRMGGANVCAVPNKHGTFDLWIDNCTPEQAIAATVGVGTCHLEECEHVREIPNDLPECDGGWYMEVTHDCDECGYENVDPNIRFCGGCGRRVVAE